MAFLLEVRLGKGIASCDEVNFWVLLSFSVLFKVSAGKQNSNLLDLLIKKKDSRFPQLFKANVLV